MMYAWIKSAAFCRWLWSTVSFVVLTSTRFVFKFILMSSLSCSVTGLYRVIHAFFRGVNLC